jgi:hypothetical protein
MNRGTVLEQEDLEILYSKFTNGTPIVSYTPDVPGASFLPTSVTNWIAQKIRLHRIPQWVKDDCEAMRLEKTQDGSLIGITKRRLLGGGFDEKPNMGACIGISENNGDRQVALLLDMRHGCRPRAWIVAVWNKNTGRACDLPLELL